MLTPSLEDYLEEIYNFANINEKIRIIDIAEKLKVSSPSVVKALKKLENENYIIYQKYKYIKLTNKGKKLGKFLVERNDILQNLFIMLNPKCNPAQEAEAVEHYLSPSTIIMFQKLSNFFKDNNNTFKHFLNYSKNYNKKNSINTLDDKRN